MSSARPAGRTDTASIETRAAPETVYAAFSDAAKLMRWLPPATMSGRALVFDFREGGRYRFELTYEDSRQPEAGKTSARTDVSAGRFIRLEPNRRIVQTVEFESENEAFAGEMTMTWSFEPTATGTKVTITAESVPPAISKADHDAGLNSSLQNLARFVAGDDGHLRSP